MQEETKEFLTAHLKGKMAFIKNRDNYYAMFKHVIKDCATAQLVNNVLHIEGLISDEEYTDNVAGIQQAQELATKMHGEWVVKMLEQSDTQHTIRTLVSSVYSDIFGIELKGDKN